MDGLHQRYLLRCPHGSSIRRASPSPRVEWSTSGQRRVPACERGCAAPVRMPLGWHMRRRRDWPLTAVGKSKRETHGVLTRFTQNIPTMSAWLGDNLGTTTGTEPLPMLQARARRVPAGSRSYELRRAFEPRSRSEFPEPSALRGEFSRWHVRESSPKEPPARCISKQRGETPSLSRSALANTCLIPLTHGTNPGRPYSGQMSRRLHTIQVISWLNLQPGWLAAVAALRGGHDILRRARPETAPSVTKSGKPNVTVPPVDAGKKKRLPMTPEALESRREVYVP